MIKSNGHKHSAPAAIPQASTWNPAAGLRMRAQRVRQGFEALQVAGARGATGGGPSHTKLDAAVRQMLAAAHKASLEHRPVDGSLLPLIADLYDIHGMGEGVLHPNTQFNLRNLLLFVASLALDHIEKMAPQQQQEFAHIANRLEDLGLQIQDIQDKNPTEPPRTASNGTRQRVDSFTASANRLGEKSKPLGPESGLQALSAPMKLRRPNRPVAPGGLDQVSHHLPHDRLPRVLRSVKVKWPKELYADQPFAGSQYSKLYDNKGQCFVMSGKKMQGTSGKLHYAFNMDQPNEMLAVKATRHHGSRRRRNVNQSRTVISPRELTRFEVQVTVGSRNIIEEKMASYDALPLSHDDSLKKARSHAMPFVLHGLAENAAKSYMIMSKDLGDVGQLATHLGAEAKKFATLSLWAQAISELQFLHEDAQFAHLDLSTANIFFTESGQFKIMDFGLVEPLEGSKTASVGIRGNIVTPEAVAYGVRGADHLLSSATDVFAMGVVTALFAAPADVDNIFHHSYRLPGSPSAEDSRRAVMVAYAEWRRAITNSGSRRITAEAVLQGPKNGFRSLFAPLAQSNPEVCEAILNDAMAIDPEKRLSAAALGTAARRMLPSNTGPRNNFIAAIGALRNTDGEQELYENMAMYDAWDQQKVQAEQERISATRGQARPIPG